MKPLRLPLLRDFNYSLNLFFFFLLLLSPSIVEGFLHLAMDVKAIWFLYPITFLASI